MRGVDDQVPVRLRPGLGEKTLTHPPMELLALPLHAIQQRIETSCRNALIHIEDDGQVIDPVTGAPPGLR